MSVIKYQRCFYWYNHAADRDRDDGVNRKESYKEEMRDQMRGESTDVSVILEEERKERERKIEAK